ncbi:type IV pilin [Halobellus sp. Atlit-31R]|nr:type IV pilin [Halobellus sp. Atlit-31R]
MTRQTYLRSDDRAVSPEIGILLMIVVTVSLAGVVGTFVLLQGDAIDRDTPQASFDWEYDRTTQSVTVSQESGEELNATALGVDELGSRDGITLVEAGEGETYAPDDDVARGTYEPGETIRIVWQPPSGDEPVTLDESTAPGG